MRRAQLVILAASVLAIAAMLPFSISEGNRYAYSTEFLSLLLLLIPMVCTSKGVLVLPWPIVLGIGLSLILHSLGLVTDWYNQTNWWDGLTHFISGITVASLAAVTLIVVIVSSQKIRVPLTWVPFLIFVSVLAMEGFWEIFEFTLDALIGTVMQHGLSDTMEDVVANMASGVIAGLGVAYYVSKASLSELVGSMKVERIVERARRVFPG